MTRRGFTFIELIVSLLASTVLMAGLITTVAVSVRLLDLPLDRQAQWHDRDIADRVSNDLRYATSVSPETYGFAVTRPSPTTGTSESLSYEAYVNGLTRQVSSGVTMQLDVDAPGQTFSVDGYSAASEPSGEHISVRSSSTAVADGYTNSLVVDVPEGCKNDDLLLLCATGDFSYYISAESGWQTIQSSNLMGQTLLVAWRRYSSSSPITSTTVQAFPNTNLAAGIIAFDNSQTSGGYPIAWSSLRTGTALSNTASTHPTAREDSGYSNGQMHVQVFSAGGSPWPQNTLGLAGYTNVLQITSNTGYSSSNVSLGVAVRSGLTPSLSSTPRVWFENTANYLQASLLLEVTQ